ncbi:MAG: hypothetical protein K8S00_10185 [Bacteroidales bacterium]|nr:hypothetical protein [Bacteroidales bacterium]
MNALILFSNYKGIVRTFDDQDKTNELFCIESEEEFNCNQIYLFEKSGFVPYNFKGVDSDSIFVVNDKIPLSEFKKFISGFKNVEIISIIHRKPNDKENGNGFLSYLENCCLSIIPSSHEFNTDYASVYEKLYKISCDNDSNAQDKYINLINQFFKKGVETKGINQNLELLHSLLTPDGLQNNEDIVKQYISDFGLNDNVSTLKSLNFKDDQYQNFLAELRDNLLR